MLADEKIQALELFSQGRKLYKLMQFDEALKKFAEALRVCPDDGPSKVYYARCRHYVQNPPPDDWDGVFVMTTK